MDRKITAIIGHYLQNFNSDGWVEACNNQKSLEEAIFLAAMASKGHMTPEGYERGDKHPHQWKRPKKILKTFAGRVQTFENEICQAQSFHELIHTIYRAKCHDVAELTIYDTALRLGTRLNHKPKVVYLHAGTLKGYQNLMGSAARFVIDPDIPSLWHIQQSALPAQFNSCGLTCSQIEDILCIYKDHLYPWIKLEDCAFLNENGYHCCRTTAHQYICCLQLAC